MSIVIVTVRIERLIQQTARLVQSGAELEPNCVSRDRLVEWLSNLRRLFKISKLDIRVRYPDSLLDILTFIWIS
jgi:hypothetical protein